MKEKLLQDEETKQLYLTEKRVDELQSLLKEMRFRADVTISHILALCSGLRFELKVAML
ncbi:hypothetical protein [Haemophilus parahaemolyticus]